MREKNFKKKYRLTGKGGKKGMNTKKDLLNIRKKKSVI